MTLVVITQFDEDFFILSDSRISLDRPVLDTMSKLSILNVRVFVLGSQNGLPLGERQPSFSTTFGVAFSGSTLVAGATFSLASAVLGSLQKKVDDPRPTFDEIAEYYRKSMQEVSLEIGTKSKNGLKAVDCSIALIGNCPVSKKVCIASFLNRETDEGFITSRYWVEHPPGEPVQQYLGSVKAFDRYKYVRFAYNMLPITAVQCVIDDETFPDVGGGIQIMVVNRAGAFFAATTCTDGITSIMGRNAYDVKVGTCTPTYLTFRNVYK